MGNPVPPFRDDQPQALADQHLGRCLRYLIETHGHQDMGSARIIASIQDLLGEDTSLLTPLRDALRHPGLPALFAEPSVGPRLAGRDALLEELAATYNAKTLQRVDRVLSELLQVEATQEINANPHIASPFNLQTAAPNPHFNNHSSSFDPPLSRQTQPESTGIRNASGSGTRTARDPSDASSLTLLTFTTALFGILSVTLALILAARREPIAAQHGSVATSGGQDAALRNSVTATPRQSPDEKSGDDSATEQQTPQDPSSGSQAPEASSQESEGCQYQPREGAEMEQFTCNISTRTNDNQDRVVEVKWSDGKSSNYIFRPDGSVETWFQGKQDSGRYRRESLKGDSFVRIDAQKDRDVTWLPISVLE